MPYPQVFLDWKEATRQSGIAIGEERAKRELVLRQMKNPAASGRGIRIRSKR